MGIRNCFVEKPALLSTYPRLEVQLSFSTYARRGEGSLAKVYAMRAKGSGLTSKQIFQIKSSFYKHSAIFSYARYFYHTMLSHCHIVLLCCHNYISLFLHELPVSKTKINLAIHHSHKGLVTITKIKTYLKLFSLGVVFDLLQGHQINFQLFFEVKSVGSSLMLKGISFQLLRAEYENPFFAYSRLYLGIWIFLQNRVLFLEWCDIRLNLFYRLSEHSLLKIL